MGQSWDCDQCCENQSLRTVATFSLGLFCGSRVEPAGHQVVHTSAAISDGRNVFPSPATISLAARRQARRAANTINKASGAAWRMHAVENAPSARY